MTTHSTPHFPIQTYGELFTELKGGEVCIYPFSIYLLEERGRGFVFSPA
jgi:hypothetical protein